MAYICRCQDNATVSDSQGQCVPPIACFAGLCGNGGTCVVINGLAGCICPPQWRGMFCYEAIPVEERRSSASINTTAVAIAVPIILGLLLLRKKQLSRYTIIKYLWMA